MIKLAIGISVILILVILFLIFRVQTLVSVMRGTYHKRASTSNKVNAILFVLVFIIGIVLFFWYSNVASENYLPVASEHGKSISTLFWVTTYITVIIFVVTNFFLFYFAYKYQYNERKEAYFYPHNDKLELVWTVVPAIVLTLLVFFGWRTWSDVMAPPEGNQDPVVVEVMGKQFNWEVRYPGEDEQLGNYNYQLMNDVRGNSMGIDVSDEASFDDFTPGAIHLPVDKQILFKIRSRDVLHSVYIPHFRMKMDAVPGMPTSFTFTPNKTTKEMRRELDNPDFNYELACAELCGTGHFAMQMRVVVHEQEAFEKWQKEQTPWIVQNAEYIEDVPENLKNEALAVLKEHKEPKEIAEMDIDVDTSRLASLKEGKQKPVASEKQSSEKPADNVKEAEPETKEKAETNVEEEKVEEQSPATETEEVSGKEDVKKEEQEKAEEAKKEESGSDEEEGVTEPAKEDAGGGSGGDTNHSQKEDTSGTN